MCPLTLVMTLNNAIFTGADRNVNNLKQLYYLYVISNVLRQENARSNVFIAKQRRTEITTSLNSSVMEYVWDAFKLRCQTGIGASFSTTTTEFCPIVAEASTGLLTI